MSEIAYMSYDDSRLVICIPAYNESKRITDVIQKAKLFSSIIIVCDDGSSDNTVEVARAAGAKIVRHAINKGYGAAIKTLFYAAKNENAEIMVTIDSDGQHDPNQIPKLVEPILKEGYDMVIGSRFLSKEDRQKVPTYRSIGIRTITRFTQAVSYSELTDAQSGFRAYSKNALSKINLIEEGMAVSTEILVRAKQNGLSVKEVPVTIRYDVEDASTHNPLSHGIGVLSSVVRFISLQHPLAFYGVPGLVLLALGGFFMTGALNAFSSTRYVSTNMILLSIGTSVIGIVLLVTGVILYTMIALLRERLENF